MEYHPSTQSLVLVLCCVSPQPLSVSFRSHGNQYEGEHTCGRNWRGRPPEDVTHPCFIGAVAPLCLEQCCMAGVLSLQKHVDTEVHRLCGWASSAHFWQAAHVIIKRCAPKVGPDKAQPGNANRQPIIVVLAGELRHDPALSYSFLYPVGFSRVPWMNEGHTASMYCCFANQRRGSSRSALMVLAVRTDCVTCAFSCFFSCWS